MIYFLSWIVSWIFSPTSQSQLTTTPHCFWWWRVDLALRIISQSFSNTAVISAKYYSVLSTYKYALTSPLWYGKGSLAKCLQLLAAPITQLIYAQWLHAPECTVTKPLNHTFAIYIFTFAFKRCPNLQCKSNSKMKPHTPIKNII